MLRLSLPVLPYSYDDLEPFIDKKTMASHHLNHHGSYIERINKELERTNVIESDEKKIVSEISLYNDTIRNYMGACCNHSLWWFGLRSPKQQDGSQPSELLLKEISKAFGGFEMFKKKFEEEALKLFGSGWVWLLKRREGLAIGKTANQDNPLMDILPEFQRGVPIFCIDMWEHAYYLKYRNRKKEYLNAYWHVLNWKVIEQRWREATS